LITTTPPSHVSVCRTDLMAIDRSLLIGFTFYFCSDLVIPRVWQTQLASCLHG